MRHNEQYRYGSASWSSEAELRRAGMLGGKGLQIGYWGNTPLSLDTDAPSITIAGAGGGKMRDLLALAVANNAGERMFILDPRGEIAAVTMPNFALYKSHAYTWNPCGIAGLAQHPQHRCNPLDVLSLSSPRFHADCKFIAESLIPFSGAANGKYFEQRAREWAENILKARVEQNGSVSFPDLFRTVNIIETDPQAWAAQCEFMLRSSIEGVRRTAAEMLTAVARSGVSMTHLEPLSNSWEARINSGFQIDWKTNAQSSNSPSATGWPTTGTKDLEPQMWPYPSRC